MMKRFKIFYLILMSITAFLFLLCLAGLAFGGLGLIIAGSIRGETWWLAYLMEYSLIATPIPFVVLVVEAILFGIFVFINFLIQRNKKQAD